MSLKKVQKILLVAGGSLLVLQLPWYITVQAYVSKTQVRTTARVVRIISEDARCTGDNHVRLDPTCDHSRREYPVYEYFDELGKRYEQDDKFFGEYKQNNPIRSLFWKNVGDSVTAYYPKDKPKEVLFMTGPLAYTAWLIPIYLSISSFVAFGVISIVKRYKQS